MKKNKKPKYILAICFSLLFVEFFSYLVIWISPHFGVSEIRRTSDIFCEQSEKLKKFFDAKECRLQIDQALGWRYRANYNEKGDIINSQYIRSIHEYTPKPSSNKIRVAAFGDSFVYGCEVRTIDSWPHLIEERAPNIEVLNFGVGGYGSDQAYLRYKLERKQFNSNIVIIGFFPVMLQRNLNVYRRFFSTRELVLIKPRFILSNNGKLKLIRNPISQKSDYKQFLVNPSSIRKVGKFDYYYEPLIYENPLYDYSAAVRVFTTFGIRFYNRYLSPNRILKGSQLSPSSPAVKLQMAIFDNFISDIKQDDATPIIVIFPAKQDLLQAMQGNSVIYDSVVKHFDSHHIQYIDIRYAFLSLDLARVS